MIYSAMAEYVHPPFFKTNHNGKGILGLWTYPIKSKADS